MSNKLRPPSSRNTEGFDASEAEQLTPAIVLSRKQDWNSFVVAGFITPNEKGVLSDYDTDEGRDADIANDQGEALVGAFVKLLNKVRSEPAVQYILTLIEELLLRDKSQATLFERIALPNFDPYEPFLSLLNSEASSSYVISKNVHVLSLLMSSACKRQIIEPAQKFLEWILDQVQRPQSKTLLPAVTALKELLKNELFQYQLVPDEAQSSRFDAEEGEFDAKAAAPTEEKKEATNGRVLTRGLHNLHSVTQLLVSQSQNTQVLYEVGFCLWLLSFNSNLHKILREVKVVKHLVGVIKSLLRVKVVRIALSTLRNLLDKERFNEEMIDAGLPKILPTLSARAAQWEDEDIVEDVRLIEESIQKDIKELSSFEMYEKEVTNGELQWTVVHSEKFWRENFQKFEKENFKMIKKLIELLSRPDKTTIEVACYDLGEFARFHPNGKKVIQKLDGKTKLMAKLTYPSAEVQKQALLAVQKLMVNNWEFLSKS
eukprot:TRINITY_DN1070_c0_g1_i4.p1 TRINITY_DN1070_c0_g1~~TRINITY_DN1070_c0_g1_i4.p1  ORF type:complete len:514 (+),score=176.44 TRINITY_DN1070_c0_g1_i4:83-1543(+)